MDCKKLLYNLDELVKHKECFLSDDHYYRALLAISTSKAIHAEGEYVFVGTRFVFGVDDSGKIFVRDWPHGFHIDRMFFLGVRDYLGFNFHSWEVKEIKEGMRIRLQGDLALRVIRVFKDTDDLIDSIASDYNEQLWEEFIRDELGKEMRTAERLTPLYMEFRRLYYEKLAKGRPTEEVEEIKRIMKEIREKLRKEYKVPFSDIENIRRVIAFRNKEKFKEYMINKIEKLVIRMGNYTTPHTIRVTGILLRGDFLARENPRVIILQPQWITISHEEHGGTTFYIDKPAIVEFYTI
ncbi:hypothetical protein SJAV_26940 [Sulfurisphaera javensis]|uniref:Uncharacterized protein n=1 Tax=Sulfurisphaera javensis TaxID=2049879 RepID=A0AAT9GV29_9CREN